MWASTEINIPSMSNSARNNIFEHIKLIINSINDNFMSLVFKYVFDRIVAAPELVSSWSSPPVTQTNDFINLHTTFESNSVKKLIVALAVYCAVLLKAEFFHIKPIQFRDDSTSL